MDLLHQVRRVQDKSVHPAFQCRPPEISGAGVERLQASSHAAVKDEDTLTERFEK